MSSDHSALIMSYMKSQNRPYSVQNVFDNLRGEVPRAKVVVCLDGGVDSGSLVVKAFGAQKIYCWKQEASMQSGEDAVDGLKTKLATVSEALTTSRASLQSISEQSSVFVHYRGAVAQKTNLVARIAEIHRQINTIEESRPSSVGASTPAFGEAVEEQIAGVQAERDRRRRIAKEMMGQVSEACGVSRSELAGDLGLELDLPRGL